MNRTKPCEVLGHAGADGFYPANSIDSFRKALEIGVDRIECDVTADKDHVIFLVHDQELPVDGTNRNVRALAISEIRRADPSVILLDDLLALTRGTTPLLLDLKARGIETALIHAIQAMRAEGGAPSISSTHARSLRAIAKAVPEMRVGLSRGHWLTRVPKGHLRSLAGWGESFLQIVPLLALGKWCHATEFMLFEKLCVPPLLRILHAAGFRVYAWTPSEPSEFETLLDRGVDGIISHRPDRLIQTIEKCGVPRL